MKSLVVLLVAILSFNQFCFSQAKDPYKAMETEADKLFKEDKFNEALPMYMVLDSVRPNYGLAKARIGISFMSTATKYKALPYLQSAKKLGHNKDGLDYYLGRAYHLNHDFDNAINAYQGYKGSLKKKDEISEMDDLIRNCVNGKELIKTPVNVSIENLGPNINSSFGDFAPIISGDEAILLFTSKRPNSGRKNENGDYFEDIYFSVKEGGKWTNPLNLGSVVNTSVNDAAVGVSLDGQHLFIYQNDTLDKDASGGDIYQSNLKENEWSKPLRLNEPVNTPHWEPSSSMDSKEEILFFTSDRPDGMGGTDIYVSHRLPNKMWGPAKNLGPKINTPLDEDAPFIHADGKTLYFSSKGHNSMGGFDIFNATYNPLTDEVGPATNIGYPVNSADDELFFVWSADGKRGYFSSAREDSYGEEDIYLIRRPDFKLDLVLLDGKVASGSTSLTPKFTVVNNDRKETIATYDSTKFSKEYIVVLETGKNQAVYAESHGYLMHNENINLPSGFHKLRRDINFKPLEKGSLVILNNIFFDSLSAELKPASQSEIERCANFLKAHPSLVMEIAGHSVQESTAEANATLSSKRANEASQQLVNLGIGPERIKAVGYGDRLKLTEGVSSYNNRIELIVLQNLKPGESIATTEGYYNDLEKDKNATATVMEERREQLIESIETQKEDEANFLGVPFEPKKITKVEKETLVEETIDVEPGTSKKNLVKATKNENITIKGEIFDNATGKKLSARVQLRNESGEVLKEITTGSDGKYSFITPINYEKLYSVYAEKQGYNFNSAFLEINSEKDYSIKKDIALKQLKEGTKFLLKHIYYDINLSSLRRESYEELDKLLEMLQENKDLRLEVIGHTDSHGGEVYNHILSQKRAESVKAYLFQKGIAQNRVVALGMGEQKPLASNEDEEEGRELNRRTEILILKNK